MPSSKKQKSSWSALYTLEAQRNFEALPKDVQKRIANKMRYFVSSSNPLKFAEHIRDKDIGDFRLRVGRHRVIFDVDYNKKQLIVLKIGPRDQVYR